MQRKIAFLDRVHPVLEEGLMGLGWNCVDLTKTSQQRLEEEIGGYHGIVIRSRLPMNATFLKHAVKLEFIARSGAGMENIDEQYCQSRGIKLFNAPEGNRNAVAEHALGMLLSLFNNLNKADREVRDGIWDREGNRGVELDGQTVGIIGYGNNGSTFAKKLRGFDVRVMAYDKYKSGFGNEFIEEVTLSEIQENATVVSLHVPETPVTRGMINERFIDQMNHPFYLINLSRGVNVVSTDLMDAIETGEVLGACLDVLEYEKSSFENLFDNKDVMPLPLKYLIQSDKTILSPHVGGWTFQSYEKLSQVLLDKIKKEFTNN
jgi:D-3-phosphoglycerate dehydrogenase / 2-oxoglutarate reductase